MCLVVMVLLLRVTCGMVLVVFIMLCSSMLLRVSDELFKQVAVQT